MVVDNTVERPRCSVTKVSMEEVVRVTNIILGQPTHKKGDKFGL